MSDPYYQDETIAVYHGDCVEVMRTMPDETVDAVITDPPYGIRFMGESWDGADISARQQRGKLTSPMPQGVGGPNGGYRSLAAEAGRYDLSANAEFQEWCAQWAAECLRLLKPGGYLLAFGGSRTWHRLAAGIEDAGFEIRDSIAWLYGSGFPKSMDVSKAIDAHLGAIRQVVGTAKGAGNGSVVRLGSGRSMASEYQIAAPATDSAAEWEGWGTALKPAFEPIVVARKPVAGTVASNVLAYGTGALHIDACRTHTSGSQARAYTVKRLKPGATLNRTGGNWRPGGEDAEVFEGATKDGRWPTNVVLDESQAAELDSQSGLSVSRAGKPRSGQSGEGWSMTATGAEYDDQGGASRFFPTFHYEAKAPTAERPEVDGVQHPTVKPLALMQWLVRLVARPGALVLEPFAGSGTTLEACIAEGVRCVGIEREAKYLPLIRQRLSKDIDIPLDLGGIA